MRSTNTKKVEFSCYAPTAKAVFVAGTFNDWKLDAVPLRHLRDGSWTGTLSLPPGHHEFKFVIDGQWCCEPGCEHEYRGCPKCVPNELGTMNRVLEVSEPAPSESESSRRGVNAARMPSAARSH